MSKREINIGNKIQENFFSKELNPFENLNADL